MFFTRTRLAMQDKNIIKSLKYSEFISNFSVESLDGLIIDDLNHSEKWLEEIRKFIKIAENKAKYREPFRMLGFNIDDMYSAYVYMTLATVPNPILKTGKQNLTVSAVGSCMYQEERQFNMFLADLSTNIQEKDQNPLKTTAVGFGKGIKIIHEMRNGEIKFNNVPY